MAGALLVPMTVGTASAQSSFVSGSSSSSDAPNTNYGSKASQLQRAAEQVFTDNGQIKSPAAEATAKKLLQRALNYEIPFVDNAYETVEGSPVTYSLLLRFPVAEIDTVLQNAENNAGIDAGFGGVSAPFGVAVGKDSDYYYIALSMIAG